MGCIFEPEQLLPLGLQPYNDIHDTIISSAGKSTTRNQVSFASIRPEKKGTVRKYRIMPHRLTQILALLFALFLAGIVYLADSSQSCFLFDLARSTPYGDKIGHFLLSGFFTLLTTIAFKYKGFRNGTLFLPYGALLIFLLVTAEEASQHFFPNRTCDPTDLLADLAGIFVFSITLYCFRSRESMTAALPPRS
jgi:hypothetical protein